MNRGSIAIVTVLVAFLIAAVWFAVQGLLLAGEPMPRDGYIAMIIGVVLSLLVGAGLMALLFISSRRGYDEPPHIEQDGD
jgi:hypothetical protein